jgi:hypothetical protein
MTYKTDERDKMKTYPQHFHKSLDLVDGNLQLSTTENGIKRVSQPLRQILESGIVLPNTNHTILPKRLCVSFVCGWYAGASYRPNGIYFATYNRPDFCCPVDVMNLTMDPKNTSCTNESEFIPGYQKLFYGSVDEMVKEASCPVNAEILVNKFRAENGQEKISTSSYNECCFYSPVRVKPLALYGPEAKEIAEEFGIDYYPEIHKLSEAILYSLKYNKSLGKGDLILQDA